MALSRSERHRERFLAPALRVLIERLGAQEASVLIDIGGGTGWVSELVGAGCARRVVVEPKASYRKKGQRRRPAIEFVEGKGEKLPFPDASFDRAMLVVSFHHFGDAQAGLRELHRVLRPGGIVCIVEFLPHSHQGKRAKRLVPDIHLAGPEAVVTALEDASFRVTANELVEPGFVVAAVRP